jgi:hypothetical protein
MPANTSPIWTLIPNVGNVDISTTAANVNTTAPGTIGTNCFLAFTSGVNGSYLQKVRFSFVSTTSVISSVNTTLQVYLSSINTGATSAANTDLLAQVQAAAQTVSAVTTAPYQIEIPINFAIPASRYILVTQSVAQTTNANWQALVIGGDY